MPTAQAVKDAFYELWNQPELDYLSSADRMQALLSIIASGGSEMPSAQIVKDAFYSIWSAPELQYLSTDDKIQALLFLIADSGLGGGGGGGSPTNLSIANPTASTLDIASSTGVDVTIPAATTSLAGLESAADKSKLNGIAAGATANSTDAQLRDRSTHTGTQASSTISDFVESAQDAAAALLTNGTHTGISYTYNDAGNVINSTVTGGSGATNLSLANLTGTTIDILSDTGTDVTLPAATTSVAGLESAADKTKLNGIATGATANSTDAQLRDRSTHTGTQTASTISDFNSAVVSANSRLNTIATQANPASPKLTQLNTNGTISFVDPPTGGGGGTITGVGNFIYIPFSYTDSATLPLFTTVDANTRILTATVVVDTAFNGTGTTFTIGDSGNNSSVMESGTVIPGTPNEYESNRQNILFPTIGTVINLYRSGTGITQGAGMVILEIYPSVAGNYQPLDSDLTAIAALSTTSFGRGLLTLANSTALLSAAGAVGAVTAGAKLWIGTQTAYNALGTYDANTLYTYVEGT